MMQRPTASTAWTSGGASARILAASFSAAVALGCGADDGRPEAEDSTAARLLLECPGEVWSVQAGTSPDADTADTAEEALAGTLEPYAERLGGEVRYQAPVGAIELDGRRVARATAVQVDGGGWLVDTTEGCVDITAPGMPSG